MNSNIYIPRQRVEIAFHLHVLKVRHSVRKNVISSPYRQLTALCQDLLLFQVES